MIVAVRGEIVWADIFSDTDLESVALALDTRATQRSAPLVRRTKQTLQTTVGLTSLDEAFALELDAQEWSVNQPEFTETVRRIQADIAARKSTGTSTSQRSTT